MPQVRRPHAPKVRFSDEELAALRERARECGRPVARYVRETALGSVPKARRHAAEQELIRHLARIGNNLNQLAREANGAAQFPAEERIDALLAEIHAAIERLA